MKVIGATNTPHTRKIQPTKITSTGEAKLEIERRFLVKELPEDLEQYPHEEIEQGYMSTDKGTSIRIRQKGGIYYQTIKRGTGKVRYEIEVEIPDPMYKALWGETDGRRLEKTRYEIPHEDNVIQLDIYHRNLEGLMTVEVEFQTEEEADSFIPPDWFGAEVTDVEKFGNRNLATNGIPKKLLKKLSSS